MRIAKFLVIHVVALRSTINTEFVSQVSWRKIRIVSGFIVFINYAVTSRRLQEFKSFGSKGLTHFAYIFYSKEWKGKNVGYFELSFDFVYDHSFLIVMKVARVAEETEKLQGMFASIYYSGIYVGTLDYALKSVLFTF